jgi:hypothetical protein
MARPFKTSPEFILAQIDNYLETCGREQTSLPTRYAFAKYCGISEDALLDYEKLSATLSGALKKIDNEQRSQLMNDGLYGGKEVNPGMAIFLLKANHGLKETNVVENSGLNGKPIEQKLTIEIIEERQVKDDE